MNRVLHAPRTPSMLGSAPIDVGMNDCGRLALSVDVSGGGSVQAADLINRELFKIDPERSRDSRCTLRWVQLLAVKRVAPSRLRTLVARTSLSSAFGTFEIIYHKPSCTLKLHTWPRLQTATLTTMLLLMWICSATCCESACQLTMHLQASPCTQ